MTPIPKIPLSVAAQSPSDRVNLAKALASARKTGEKVFIVGEWSGEVVEVVPDPKPEGLGACFSAN